jgi:predicted Ser/Thr protein kinase
MFRPKTKIID